MMSKERVKTGDLSHTERWELQFHMGQSREVSRALKEVRPQPGQHLGGSLVTREKRTRLRHCWNGRYVFIRGHGSIPFIMYLHVYSVHPGNQRSA